MSPTTNIHHTINRVKAGWPDTITQFGQPDGRLMILLLLTTAALFPDSPIQIDAITALAGPALWAIRGLLVVVAIGTLALHRLSCRHRRQLS